MKRVVFCIVAVSFFLPWYSLTVLGSSISSINGFHSTWGILSFLCALGALVADYMKYQYAKIISLGAPIFALICILSSPGTELFGMGYSVQWGLYLNIVVSIIYSVIFFKEKEFMLKNQE